FVHESHNRRAILKEMERGMWEKLDAIQRRYDSLTAEMARPEVATDYVRFAELDKERAGIESVVSLYREYQRVSAEMDEARTLLEESTERELRDLAREELDELGARREALEAQIRAELVPKDP